MVDVLGYLIQKKTPPLGPYAYAYDPVVVLCGGSFLVSEEPL